MKLNFPSALNSLKEVLNNFGKFSISSNENHNINISILSIIAFYVIMTIYACCVFFQFPLIQIAVLSFVVLGILFVLVKIFLPYTFRSLFSFSISNLLYSLVLVFGLTLLTIIPENSWVNNYVHNYPLLDIENGYGWYRDTVFHVSIIQSILNFGYPSISQHDSPLMIYHVFSHYIDALILLITRLEPFDSYGLLFHFKKFLLLSSIVLFLGHALKKISKPTFVILVFIIAPIIISTWHLIGSHGLWFVSILILLSANKVHKLIGSDLPIDKRNIAFLFFLGIIIMLGKISSGFAFMLFIGLIIFIKNYKNYLTYVLGFSWFTFLYVYQGLMLSANIESGNESLQTTNWNNLKITNILDSIQNISKIHHAHIIGLYTSIILLGILVYFFRSRNSIVILSSSILSFLILVLITELRVDFSISDVWYFYFGLNFLLFIYVIPTTYMVLYKAFQNIKTKDHLLIRFSKFTLFISIISAGTFYQQTEINILDSTYESICINLECMNTEPFKVLNAKNKTKYSVKKILLGMDRTKLIQKNRPLLSFRCDLNDFLRKHNIYKNNVVLFLPKEIMENDLAKMNGDIPSIGMLIYSITGTPLIYGIKESIRGYGHSSYPKNKFWKSEKNFKSKDIFKSISKDYIVKVDNLSTGTFTLINKIP